MMMMKKTIMMITQNTCSKVQDNIKSLILMFLISTVKAINQGSNKISDQVKRALRNNSSTYNFQLMLIKEPILKRRIQISFFQVFSKNLTTR